MTDSELMIERVDGYVVLTLNRPQAMNALSQKLARIIGPSRAGVQQRGKTQKST